MAISSSEFLVRLVVLASDYATEVFLIDGNFRRIATGLGRLESYVAPGIYKVRLLAGGCKEDHLIEIGEQSDSILYKPPPVKFETAAPIASAAHCPTSHQSAAQMLSQSIDLNRGTGSWIFLFARDLSPSGKSANWHTTSIHSSEGRELARLSDGQPGPSSEYCGLNLEVDPGTYRLRVECGEKDVYEMFVVATEGWQTQVFALVEDEPYPMGQSSRRISLPTVSMFMARPEQGFDPDCATTRHVELVRLALITSRNLMPNSVVEGLLRGPDLNPLLGIFGAHLLMNRPETDYSLIARLIEKLGKDIASQADVQAILTNRHWSSNRNETAFHMPPMLYSSWNLIVQASRRRMSLVPQGSLTDQVSDGLLHTAPWLVHWLGETTFDQKPLSTYVSFASARRKLDRLWELQPGERDRVREELESQTGFEPFTPLEQNLLMATALRPEAMGKGNLAPPQQSPSMASVLNDLDSPNYAVARAIHSVVDKLGLRGKD